MAVDYTAAGLILANYDGRWLRLDFVTGKINEIQWPGRNDALHHLQVMSPFLQGSLSLPLNFRQRQSLPHRRVCDSGSRRCARLGSVCGWRTSRDSPPLSSSTTTPSTPWPGAKRPPSFPTHSCHQPISPSFPPLKAPPSSGMESSDCHSKRRSPTTPSPSSSKSRKAPPASVSRFQLAAQD